MDPGLSRSGTWAPSGPHSSVAQIRVDSRKFGATRWDRLRFYARFAWRFVVLRRPEPLILGIAVTDLCNLGCRGCHLANTGRADMTWAQVVGTMRDGWGRGFRELYFTGQMSGWWWLYWRFYDTRIPLSDLDTVLGVDAAKGRRWLKVAGLAGLAIRRGGSLDLTEPGAFWLHLAQNHFALNYVNTIWTQARRNPWPSEVVI